MMFLSIIYNDKSINKLLIIIAEAYITKEVVDTIKSKMKRTDVKVALVGFTGIKKVIVAGIMKFTKTKDRLFNTEDEAKIWLINSN